MKARSRLVTDVKRSRVDTGSCDNYREPLESDTGPEVSPNNDTVGRQRRNDRRGLTKRNGAMRFVIVAHSDMVSLTRPAINNGDKDRYLPSLSSPNLRRTTAVFRRHSSRIEVDFSSASYGHKTPGNL
ncbi:hypothetical protein LSAT2_010034 [Lamellibrachia satsuma]|nr:hypothetical protein LSAT2_010034 [Lamellibrachia satsuma]